MQRFSAKYPSPEAVVLTFNFVLFLPPGVFLAGTPAVTFGVVFGTDPNPGAINAGPPAVDSTGTLVLQPVVGGLDGNDYLITASCPTTNGYWTPALPAILPVRLYPSKSGAP
jgi:hypothetical protein